MSTPETNQAPGLTDAECRDRLRLILEIVRKYQPPHNISKDDVLCEVIRLLGPQSGGVDVAVKPAANQDADDLDDMLVVRHLSPRAAGETLRQAVDRIINWEMMVNMDPVVCSAAQALVYKGRDEGLVSVIQHLNQNPYSLSKSECIHTVQGMRGVSRDPPLAQDQDRGLFDALSRDPNARQHVRDAAQAIEAVREQEGAMPIDMVLHCPACGMQHIDAPSGEIRGGEFCLDWANPPHRSHLCSNPDCKHVWRPADVATNGVVEVKTKGDDDSEIEKDGLRPWPMPDDIAQASQPFVHILREANQRQELWLMSMFDGYMRPVGAAGPIRMPDGWRVELHKFSEQKSEARP